MYNYYDDYIRSILGYNNMQNQIGTISQLPTTNKSSIVSSIIEILSMIQVSSSEPLSQPNNGWWMKEL